MVRTPGRVKQFVSTRFYYKPSLNKMIIRVAGVNRRSEKVREINDMVKEAKEKGKAPAKVAHEMCVKAGKTVNGVCPIEEFRKFLRDAMKQTVHKVE